MADNNTDIISGNQGRPKPRLTLSIDIDEVAFEAIVAKIGVHGWNEWIGRLIDHNATMAVWSEGEAPPSVSVFIAFKEDIRSRWPTADFRPVEVLGAETQDDEAMPDLRPSPSEEFGLPGVKVSCLLNHHDLGKGE